MSESTNYRRSDDIKELATAFVKVQMQIQGAKRDAENPHLRSKYADLASCWDACREALTQNGFSVLQPASSDGEKVTVTTLLLHVTGQWISSDLSLKPTQTTPQGAGSAITYARRYGLTSMIGISPEDDDGEEASNGVRRGSRAAQQKVAERKLEDLRTRTQSEPPREFRRAEPGPLPENDPSTAPQQKKSTHTDFDALKKFSKAKESLGAETYYRILGSHGYEHANEIVKPDVRERILQEMRDIAKEYKSVPVA